MAAVTTFYTVSNAAFFPGTVALLNSLRLTGHDERFVVLDAGLMPTQRHRLAPHAEVVEVPERFRANPYLLKPYPALMKPTGTIALIDSDMLVTASLKSALTLAGDGKICVFPDHQVDQGRWFAEWESMLSLAKGLRHQTYANAGFVVLSMERRSDFLDRWWRLCELVPPDRPRGDDHPLRDRDQDVMNALLMSEIPPEAIEVLPEAAEVYADAFCAVEIRDTGRLECTRGGDAVSILHHCLAPKLWQEGGWRRMARGDPYAALLRRVWYSVDVPLRLTSADVPWWLWPRTPPLLANMTLATRKGLGKRYRKLRRSR